MKYLVLTSILVMVSAMGISQETIMNEELKNHIDSLERRIQHLEAEIPRLKRSRHYNLYFKKQELEKTRFIHEYEKLAFEEDLLQAEMILNAKTKSAIKRNDQQLLNFYQDYHKDLINKMKSQSERYQELFAKEKSFKKELYRFINMGDEYNILRAQRMVELALKYAYERKLGTTLEYLQHYKKLVDAEVFDFYSDYNLMLLANSEHQFEKQILPLIESDSLSDIMEAQKIVENCYKYATIGKTKLDTNYFEFQKNMVSKAITDYHKRQGDMEFLEEYADQAVLAKLDSLNKKGIYRWNEYIIVIDELKPNAQFKNVQKGEAIIDADRKLIEYIRINRLAKVGKEVEVGPTMLIPFCSDDGPVNFHFNPEAEKWQYIICYTKVKNDMTTKKVNAYLPPLQFENKIIED